MKTTMTTKKGRCGRPTMRLMLMISMIVDLDDIRDFLARELARLDGIALAFSWATGKESTGLTDRSLAMLVEAVEQMLNIHDERLLETEEYMVGSPAKFWDKMAKEQVPLPDRSEMLVAVLNCRRDKGWNVRKLREAVAFGRGRIQDRVNTLKKGA